MPLSRHLPKNSQILWMISLIQDKSPEAQTKSEFKEMTSDITSVEAIDKITLCLADNLQRFRFMIETGCTELEGIEKCQQLSNEWHEDNAESLEKLKLQKNLSIIKWSEFLEWPEYENTVKAVQDLYIKDNKFKKDVDGRIRQEIEKLKYGSVVDDPVKQTELLKKYLFEESAFQKFVASKRFKLELYKTPFPPPAKRILNNSDFVPPGFLSEVHFTQYQNNSRNTHVDRAVMQQNPSSTTLNIPIGLDFPVSFDSLKQRNGVKNGGFGSVFESPKKITPLKELTDTQLSHSPEKKLANFIESTISLLPLEHRENAIKALIQFTTQKIIPLSYEKNINTLVI